MTGFDSLGYAQRLRSVGVPPEQAEAEAALIRDEVVARAATKGDLLDVEKRLDVKIDRVEERLISALKQLEQRMTIKLGGLAVVVVGLIVAVQKMLGS